MIIFLRFIVICICIMFLFNPEKYLPGLKLVFHKPIIHIFLDEGTFPTVQQLIYLLQLPQKDIKVVHWERLRQFEKNLKLHQKNLVLPGSFGGVNYVLGNLTKAHPDAYFEFHFNHKHTGWHVLQAIASVPPHRVRMLHMYEDSAAYIARSAYNLERKENMMATVQKIKKLLKNKAILWGGFILIQYQFYFRLRFM